MEIKREQLDVCRYKEEIIELVKSHRISIISGETGCGKSTQIPQYLLDSGMMGESARVVVTQPRRIAATAMAHRVCQERQSTLGQEVGYQIRFDQQVSSKTTLRYLTDAILLHQLVNQSQNTQLYDIVIIDEAHERSLNSEIVMALLKQALHSTNPPPLKLVIMSATLNDSLFREYFQSVSCPVGVLQMTGRLHEVDIMYSPNPIPISQQVSEAVTSVIRMHLHEGPGDILVFLNGAKDCEQAVALTNKRLQELVDEREVAGMVMLALYGQQSQLQQNRVFNPTPEEMRKVVYATNIAETSVTIPNISFVIDNGSHKAKAYSACGLESLSVESISSNQAQQRAGRAGRTQPGKVYRLYTLLQHREMTPHQQPEILRVDLQHALLQLKCLKVNDVINFDYIEKPQRENVIAALRALYLLNAIGRDHEITALGKVMTKYPLQPCYSKCVILSLFLGGSKDMSIILGALSSEGIWDKDMKEEKWGKLRKEVGVDTGDHQTYLRVYRKWLSRDKDSHYAKHKGYNQRGLQHTCSIVQQLTDINRSIELPPLQDIIQQDPIYQQVKSGSVSQSEKLRMYLAAGLFLKTAKRLPQSDNYLIVREGKPCAYDHNSVIHHNHHLPEYIVFSEIFSHQAQQPTIRILTAIKYQWVEQYLKDIKNIDNDHFLLEVQSIKRKLDPLKEKEIMNLERMALQQEKLMEAKEKFNQRKKFHNI